MTMKKRWWFYVKGFGYVDEQGLGMQRSAVNPKTTSNSVTVYHESRAEPTKQKVSDLGQQWANE